MARDLVTPVVIAEDSGVNYLAGAVAINTTNGAKIPYDKNGKLLLIIANTNGSNRVATVKASTADFAYKKGQGDLAVTVAATTGVQVIGELSQARFLQADGYLYVDFGASMTGTITAIKLL
jgi:hypothetical protein